MEDKKKVITKTDFDEAMYNIPTHPTSISTAALAAMAMGIPPMMSPKRRAETEVIRKQHMMPVGRNKSCPCGSGKSYKRCCKYQKKG